MNFTCKKYLLLAISYTAQKEYSRPGFASKPDPQFSVTKTERCYLKGRMVRYQINSTVDRITEEWKEDNGK